MKSIYMYDIPLREMDIILRHIRLGNYLKTINNIQLIDPCFGQLSFSDYSSYMLMTAQSMNVLNSKLDKPVYILNFRPNFVVDECEAFDEVTFN